MFGMRFFTRGGARRKTRYAQIAPLCDGEICYNIVNNSFAFIALLARVKPRISTVRAAIRWVRPSGRISFRDFLQGFRGPHSESGGPHSESVRGCALFL